MRANHSRGNIFVANLPPEFTDDELAETFDSFGIVLSASIARAANLAVAALRGSQVHGFTLDVRISERRAAAKKPARLNPPRRPSIRLVPRAVADGENTSGDFVPRLQPRKPPTFQVERRSLPRRG